MGCRDARDDTGSVEPVAPMRFPGPFDVDLPADRPLDVRETPEFLAIAQRVRDGLRAGHSYDD